MMLKEGINDTEIPKEARMDKPLKKIETDCNCGF